MAIMLRTMTNRSYLIRKDIWTTESYCLKMINIQNVSFIPTKRIRQPIKYFFLKASMTKEENSLFSLLNMKHFLPQEEKQ